MKTLFLTSALALAFTAVGAQTMKAPAGGKEISDNLLGIFFEDISMSADGGLNAQLVQNGSFEYNPTERDGWGAGTGWRLLRHHHATGYIEACNQAPLHENNPHFMRVYIERCDVKSDFRGTNGIGLANDGYDGIVVKAGEKYNFSAFVRNPDGKNKELTIALAGIRPAEPSEPGKRPNFPRPFYLAETKIKVLGAGWQKIEAVLTASEDYDTAALQIYTAQTGVLDVDMVSLIPQDTYKGHGLRRDLAEALEALHPKFMRFPGGCVVHGGGDGFWNTYRWKTTVGPKETRNQQKNTWGYHQSMELGYFEYFQLCEDMGMEPLPILPAGVSCQGANGGWGLREQNQWVVPMDDMEEWANEALDLIEWANGDVNTKWGKVRADAGHPAPFNMKYLGIGNEERISPEFIERYKYIYNKVREAYPEIIIVGTAGPGSHPGNPDFENGWKAAEETDLAILDEHYYEPRKYFLESRQYDSYPRDRKTKVYLGEYAAKDKKLIDALAEGLYLLHVERNADVVAMTSYAPLFAKKNHTNWNPDLIYFDNKSVFPTCSYYVQQMFGLSSGNYYYGDCVTIQEGTSLQEQSVILNTKTKELFVKVCNASADAKKAVIDLSRFKIKPNATLTVINGNDMDENDYEKQVIAPVKSDIKVQKKMTLDMPAYSMQMISIKL